MFVGREYGDAINKVENAAENQETENNCSFGLSGFIIVRARRHQKCCGFEHQS
jgi:hypothetical protein